uniref:Geminin n=1 Tax=Glossina austeni TaxID=7395 RepID=A0A1A9UZG0_GLOAU
MSSSSTSCNKIFIPIETPAEQEETLKNQRKTLGLQGEATDKENFTSSKKSDKLSRLKALYDISNAAAVKANEGTKRKKVEAKVTETKTNLEYPNKRGKTEDTAEKGETGEVSGSSGDWERLAEERRETLAEALKENQRLHECAERLEKELSASRQQVEEIQHLVAILTEMLEENERGDASNEAVDDTEGRTDNCSDIEHKKD